MFRPKNSDNFFTAQNFGGEGAIVPLVSRPRRHWSVQSGWQLNSLSLSSAGSTPPPPSGRAIAWSVCNVTASGGDVIEAVRDSRCWSWKTRSATIGLSSQHCWRQALERGTPDVMWDHDEGLVLFQWRRWPLDVVDDVDWWCTSSIATLTPLTLASVVAMATVCGAPAASSATFCANFNNVTLMMMMMMMIIVFINKKLTDAHRR